MGVLDKKWKRRDLLEGPIGGRREEGNIPEGLVSPVLFLALSLQDLVERRGGDPKTGRGPVPVLNPSSRPSFEPLRSRRGPTADRTTSTRRAPRDRWQDGDLVFTTAMGTPMDPRRNSPQVFPHESCLLGLRRRGAASVSSCARTPETIATLPPTAIAPSAPTTPSNRLTASPLTPQPMP